MDTAKPPRRALITGASSGIGAAFARELAMRGHDLVLTARRLDRIEALARELSAAHGIDAHAITADLADPSAPAALKAAIDAEGLAIDVLVNNAGYGIAGSVVDTEEQAWDDLMSVNVRGVFLCAKFAIPAMKANGGGVIVNTASVVAAVGIRNRAAYCASKGAVAALTRAIAMDHVGDGIRCNAVAPGTIDTPYFSEILAKSPDAAAIRHGLEQRQLMGRLGTPEEIAAGILFLASEESRFATGSILTLDGGWTAQ